MGRSGPLCSSLSKFPPIGPANGLQRASSGWPASTHIIGLCLSLSIVIVRARVAGVGTELKMDKRKKRPGGAEKLRLKKLKSLEVEAANC